MPTDPTFGNRASDGRPPHAPPTGHDGWRAFVRHWALVSATATGALFALGDIGEHVFDHAPGTLDAGVRAWVLAHRTPAALDAFEWVTRIGAPPVVFTVAVVVAIWLWRTRQGYGAAVAVGAPAIAVVLFNIIKQLIHRTRPAGGLLLREVTFSFPSGHAAVSAAVCGTLAWVLAREGKLSWSVAVPLAILCPALIGLSRIYLDVHWTTDVLGGWCAGAAVAALSIGLYERGRQRRARVT